MVVRVERILRTELGFLVTFSLAHVRAGCSARQPSGQPRGFSSKIFPLFKILKICSTVSAVKECHIVGIVAKLHVFYEIAFGKLYGLELVSISFWAIIWHGIGLWIHPGIKRSRGSAVVNQGVIIRVSTPASSILGIFIHSFTLSSLYDLDSV